jgi:hypothetical protein
MEANELRKYRGADRARQILPLRADFGSRDLHLIDKLLGQEWMTCRAATPARIAKGLESSRGRCRHHL